MVTYSILGSVVKALVEDQVNVVVPVPNGLDPHEWEPSAKDIEHINKADLVVENGLGLEGGLTKTLAAAKARGVPFFTACDHIVIRHVGAGEGIPSGDPDQSVGAADPHFWMDPVSMKSVVAALVPAIKDTLGIDVAAQGAVLERRLDDNNAEIAGRVSTLPDSARSLVTGHESLGYFAQQYGFKLIGVLVPSLSSQASVSAGDLAALKVVILQSGVKAIFTELGTPPAVAETIGRETNVKVVQITTHAVPPDGSYLTFMTNLAGTIVASLK